MKIGIVTYFDICNYGSVLQAYAMRNILASLGNDAVFLRIKENKKLYKYLHKLYAGFVTALKCTTSKEALQTHREIKALRKISEDNVTDVCRTSFHNFVEENLPALTIGRIALKKRASTNEFGAFICGSDQIWSPLSLSLSSHKFLEFAPQRKTIAYAPSFGVERIPSYNRNHICHALSRFETVSVRETSGAAIVKELTGKDAKVVLDPTMLLNGDEWRKLYNKHIKTSISEKYILCYFFDEPEEQILDRIAEFANDKKMRIVALSAANHGLMARGAVVEEADPWRFLSLIDNASYVFTNSFHGSVFSVLFEKRFNVFDRNHSNAVKQTSRIFTLLETVDAGENFFNKDNAEFTFAKTDEFEKKLIAARRQSLDYLIKCLNRAKSNCQQEKIQ